MVQIDAHRVQNRGIPHAVRFVVLTLAWTVLTFHTGAPAEARTRHVPSEYPTINGAMNAASSGDTVLVAPGTYIASPATHDCYEVASGVCLMSEGGPAVTIIELCGGTCCVVIAGVTGVEVSGFTFRFSHADSCDDMWQHYGVSCFDCSDVLVESCVFEDLPIGIDVGAWWYGKVSDVVVANNIFHGCETAIMCEGVSCDDIYWTSGLPEFSGNTITDGGCGVLLSGSCALFDHNVITGCRGSGVGIEFGGQSIWSGNVIAHNGASGVELLVDSAPILVLLNYKHLLRTANNIYDNAGCEVYLNKNSESTAVYASYNYWGGRCPDFAREIHGAVVYSPWVDSTHSSVLTANDCPGATEPATWGAIKAMFK